MVLSADAGAETALLYWNITTHDDTGPTFRVASAGTWSNWHAQAYDLLTPTSLFGFLAISGALKPAACLCRSTPAPAAEMPCITIPARKPARRVASHIRDDLLMAKLNVKLVNAGDYKLKFKSCQRKLFIVVMSTRKGNRCRRAA